MMRRVLMCAVLLALSACAIAPASAPEGATPGGAVISSEPLDLGGEWGRRSVGDVLERFTRAVEARYAPGLALAAIGGDLGANGFRCAANPDAGEPDAPAQICRRTETVGECTHTWQAHLFAAPDGAALERSRGLYDRRCGGEGLLGGPG